MTAAGAEAEARAFAEHFAARLAPLERAANHAAWDAAVGAGDDAMERSARARAAVKSLFADAGEARRVRAWLDAGAVGDPLLHRQLVLIGNEQARNQLPRETIEDLVRRATELERTFYDFRAELDGERVNNNQIHDVLADELDSAVRRRAWEASKQIGREVAEPLRGLVRARNAAARTLGFRDAYVMDLELHEIGEAQLFAALDEFRDLSDAPFRRFRAELDRELAARFGVAEEELRPWHWADPFCQEAPATRAVDLDAYFRDVDAVPVAAEFFRGIGLDADDVLSRSDLYEREGKDQHAFCQDMDRHGDVRILCNLRPNAQWMHVLLHELGHAVYDVYLPRSLPFLLRQPAHVLTTEAVAMYMGRLTRDPAWLRDVMAAQVSEADAAAIRGQLRAGMLIAARWMLVMAYFERELYRDPDRADLGALWWELVERLQMIRRPEGREGQADWAAKMHLSLSPVYYHNYLLGELMASQMSAAIRREAGVPAGRSIARSERAGAFLRDRIFAPGATVDWNGLLVQATGEPLTSRYFVEDFV